MPGQPQLREAGRLYAPDAPHVAAVMVRLEERMDGSGVWVVLLNSPAWEQKPKVWERDKEGARKVLDGIYREGEEKGGRWEITTYPPGQPDPE